MTENKQEKDAISEAEILEKAREIQSAQGVSLVDAMILAEQELAPAASVPESFTVTIPVKPRVAKWIMREFVARDGFTIEDRLAAYLGVVLNRSRVTAMREAQEAPEIGEGQAVTMTRRQFQAKAPQV